MNKIKKTKAIIIFLIMGITTTILQAKLISSTEEKIFKNSFHENLWGVYIQKKDPHKSFKILGNLIKKNKYAYKWLINFLHKTGNDQKIAQMIPLIKSAFPELLTKDPDTGFIVAYSLSKKNISHRKTCPGAIPLAYNNTAMDILIPLNRTFPQHQKVAALTSTLYDLNNSPQNALAISQKYLNLATPKPTDFIEHFKNAARYSKISNKKKAIESVKTCIKLQPKFPNGWVLLATLYDQEGKTQDAMNACTKALEVSGQNKIIEYMIIRLFFKLKKAQHKMSEFIMNKKCFNKAIALLRKKDHKKALKYLDQCLSQKLKTNKPGTQISQKDIFKVKLLENTSNKL